MRGLWFRKRSDKKRGTGSPTPDYDIRGQAKNFGNRGDFLDADTRLRGDDKVNLWKFVAIFGMWG